MLCYFLLTFSCDYWSDVGTIFHLDFIGWVGGYVRICIAFNMVVVFFAWILVCVGFCLLPLGSDVIVPFGQCFLRDPRSGNRNVTA